MVRTKNSNWRIASIAQKMNMGLSWNNCGQPLIIICKSDQHSVSMLTLLNQAQRTRERGNDQQVKTGLSLKGGGWGFLLTTMNMALGYFHRKIEPKEIPSCFIPRLLVVFTQQLEILVTSLWKGSWLVIKFSLLTPYAMYREQYGEDAFWKYGYYALILIQ